jgi:hypothetical protein
VRSTSDVPDGWLAIGEVCRTLGMSRTTLLAAEDAGLLTPIRTPGGHRRYDPADLRRYLGRDEVAVAAPPAELEPVASVDLTATVRAGVRELVQVLDAASGGLYLLEDSTLRFCAAFGIPRWLADRLRGRPPPAPLVEALGGGTHRLFDPVTTGFPDPRAEGQGLAAALRDRETDLGVLFLLTRPGHELLPGELRVVGACRRLLAMAIVRELRVADREQRLRRIEALSRTGGAAPPHG